jgi:four helix bundle protein
MLDRKLPEELSKRVMTFEDLEVYQRAYKTALEVHRTTLAFPKIEQFALADQMRRASRSVCSNVAEGFGRQRQSKAEYRRFLRLALGSADEMQVWVNFARDLSYVDDVQVRTWKGSYRTIARMLQALIKSWS